MTITVNLHPSWHHPSIFAALLALESPREVGDDADDLTTLLDGIDTPEPAPAVDVSKRSFSHPSPAPSPAPTPPAAPRSLPQAGRAPDRPTRAFDGAPTTGRQLYKWACDRKALPDVNAIGKQLNNPKRVTEWSDQEVATAYALLSGPPPGAYPTNGQAR
jgi:hypothetical protein